MNQQITTHILDTTRGAPAAGVKVELWRLAPGRTLAAEFLTNSDGRTDAPLLTGTDVLPGPYELLFYIADYFKTSRQEGECFFDVVPVRFIISENPDRYHVPLLISPYGYSTYRGS